MGESVYAFQGRRYVNLTNRCPTACRFCPKAAWGHRFAGRSLKLAWEPTAHEILEGLRDARPGSEAVFCGFGEPTCRFDGVRSVGRSLRGRGIKVRMNTIGLGSLVNGRDIVPELADCVDAVSVSLNTADPAQWRELHRPARQFRERGFDAVLAFIEGCAKAGLETTVTAIELPGVKTAAVEALARRMGAGFRLRPPLEPEERR